MEDFDRVYTQYFTEVYKFALGLCRDPVLAEEITQETFFKALKSIDRFQGECRISTWLCQIAKNTFLNSRKHRGAQTDTLPELIPSEEDLEERLLNRETAAAVHQVLHRLREPYKEVFGLRTFAELSFSQIGLLFGRTETWARVTYYRAKQMMKEELE